MPRDYDISADLAKGTPSVAGVAPEPSPSIAAREQGVTSAMNYPEPSADVLDAMGKREANNHTHPG